MRLLKYIQEAVYQGNIGFEELTKFYDTATEKQKQQMEKILNSGSWQKFRKLIKQVLGIELKEGKYMDTLKKLNIYLNEIKRDPLEEKLRQILIDAGFKGAMKGIPGLEKGKYKFRFDNGIMYMYKNGKPSSATPYREVNPKKLEQIANRE